MKRKKVVPITDKKFPLFPRLVATSFGFGFLPVAPGTWGAIFAILVWLPVYLCCTPMVAFIATAVATFVFTVLGTWASTESEKYWGKDPVIACVDETVGQWLSLLPVCLIPHDYWWEILLSLALFRFFDIYKPLGIRSMEKFPGGWGMMADDLLAGAYSVAILLVLNYFIV